jgi:quercetin dioxygenase-like cupin family protein
MQTEKSERKEAKPSAYDEWVSEEGIPCYDVFYIQDLRNVKLSKWRRLNCNGAFINLTGAEGTDDAHLYELEGGSWTTPEKHLYEELTFVLSGSGETEVWSDESGASKSVVSWHEGSLFSPPLNSYHRHRNSSSDPARLVSVTSAPFVFDLFHNRKFVFDCNFEFKDRFAGEHDWFQISPKLEGNILDANFVDDVRTVSLPPNIRRGAEGKTLFIELANNTLTAHISEFPVGTYKKAHRHGPGALIIVLNGKGYSLMWQQGEEIKRFDWQYGSFVSPPRNWFHQHFNTSPTSARYIALRWGGKKHPFNFRGEYKTDADLKKGGDQIEYEDESPEIRRLFASELVKEGIALNMPR